MAITGAIFDFDGTLVDSMPLWNTIFGEVSGLSVASIDWSRVKDAFAQTELLPLEQQIHAVKELLSDMWVSDGDPFEELCAAIRKGYKERVEVFPKVFTLLNEFKSAGIPMIVASSTTAPEVRYGLEVNGLDSYFVDVVSTADVDGKDKDKPDVYLEALKRLHTDLDTTWVFEDAPFGIHTAREAGFLVCALVNDHDGRDEHAIAQDAHILVHGYSELSLALFEDFERGLVTHDKDAAEPYHVLVVDGSPKQTSPALVRELAHNAAYVIAVDHGLDACKLADICPQLICGDSDSVSQDALKWARYLHVKEILFPSDKYATDLSLALDCAKHEAVRHKRALKLTVTSSSGGRPDHALGVVGLLAAHAYTTPSVIEDDFQMKILAGDHCSLWELPKHTTGKTFSLIPLSNDCVVTLKGMRWNLNCFALDLLSERGVSNVVAEEGAHIICHSGVCAAYLFN